MDIDFNKKLCEATLGEFIAAERSVAIVAGWVVAIATGIAFFVGRHILKRIQRKRNQQIPELFADDLRKDGP